jgi:5-methylcytosine-specific restriction endonuclease McrA
MATEECSKIPDGYKRCKVCLKILSQAFFQKQFAKCRECYAKIRREKRLKLVAREIIVSPMRKTCITCHAEKTSELFYADKAAIDGLEYLCKDCSKEKAMQLHRGYKLKEKIIPDEYYCYQCKKILPQETFFRNATTKSGLASPCKNCRKKPRKQRKLAMTHEQRCARRREHRKANREVELKREQESRDKRKEKIKVYNQYYSKKNIAKVLEKNERRRAKFFSVENTLTKQQWEFIKEVNKYRCVYCRHKIPLTKDHITPISAGGAHSAPNIVPACKSCNSRKRVGPPLVPVQPILNLGL